MPRRIWVTFMPSPSPSSTFSTGTSSPSNSSSQCPPCSSGPMIGMRRRMRQPGWSAMEQHGGEAAPRVVGGARQEDEVGRTLGPGDEPFAAAHDVAVAPALGPGAASCRRGRSPSPGPARSSRSRSGPGRRRSAAASAPSAPRVPTFSSTSMLPSSGAAQLQATGPEARAAQLLVDHRHADRPQALAAARPRHLRAPQPRAARLRAQPGQQVLADVLALAEAGRVRLERQQALVDEGGARGRSCSISGGRREVHRGGPLGRCETRGHLHKVDLRARPPPGLVAQWSQTGPERWPQARRRCVAGGDH